MNLDQALAGIDHHLWSSEPDVGHFLACLIRMHHFRSVVEVGVFKGWTTCHLIDALGSDGTYWGIDMEDHRSDTVRQYMEEQGQAFLLGDSLRVLETLEPESADLIFLDGDHTLEYVQAEFAMSLGLLRPGGIICIHDYQSRGVRIWVDYVRQFRGFETLALGTSENRGLAVIKPKYGPRSAGPLFRLWFRLSRNPTMLKVREKLESMKP